jgi:AAA15 family ATPase/GTPase
MIKKLSIKNFKSIKDLELDCKKINLFIGEPNTGKSNILEALGLLSWSGWMHCGINEFIRLKSLHNLFNDDLLDYPIQVQIDNICIFQLAVNRDQFETNVKYITWKDSSQLKKEYGHYLDKIGQRMGGSSEIEMTRFIKFYRYKSQNEFPRSEASFLFPPHGTNMYAVVSGNQKLRELMGTFFKPYNLNLQFRTAEKTFEVQKQKGNLVFSYPYIAISETLQRIIFYMIAIESNTDSTLIFEEPEAHAFPYYTRHLGEKIAFDKTNQYFIATHNPYLLLAILEKAHKDSVNVFITYYGDYQTKVKCLSSKEISKLMKYDPFANLDSFFDEE